MGAVTPGETLGTLYTFGVGSNKAEQHGRKSTKSESFKLAL